MSKLLEFMTKLGEDSAFRDSYVADPDGVMKNFGLTDAECKMIRTADVEGIKKTLGVEHVYLNVHVPPHGNDEIK
ncbi:hypothetical protein JCM17846_29370 [Iodidimonas nitroreducens]|uniref:Extradiol ring-cleavage dioxygenase LigAB LigA subunit domain-containing protein n=2 Tax=Iodidimonas nitroreducens TaxID=1236968 RepID=A0A5A7NCB6_9PROT|nr:hypothetical protein AQ1_01772 [alpha proteobacterium Q-1]GER05255.1 hypothetical protein JCM17846_29370 [Iodidimonas nitroreducens]